MVTAATKRKLLIAGLAAGGLGLGVGIAVAASRRKKKRKAGIKHSRKASNSRAKNRTRRTPYTAGKRPDTSRRRIRYTKNGQPYVLKYRNINGKRRKMSVFISKASAKRSRQRKGGRY